MGVIDIVILCIAGIVIHFLGFRYGVKVGINLGAAKMADELLEERLKKATSLHEERR